MSDELKPCPFCGQRVIVKHFVGMDEGNYISCIGCTRTYHYADISGIENWNTRPIEDALRARIAELDAALKTIAEYDMHKVHGMRDIARHALYPDLPIGGFTRAKGILPWKEGDELPEDAISRYRDSEDASRVELYGSTLHPYKHVPGDMERKP